MIKRAIIVVSILTAVMLCSILIIIFVTMQRERRRRALMENNNKTQSSMLHSTVHVVLTDLTTPDLPLMDKDDAVQYVTYESYSQEGGISFIQSLLNQRLINVDSNSNGSVEVVFIEQSETYPEIFNIMMKKFGTNQTFNIDSTTNYRKGNTVVFSPVDPNQDYIMFTYNGPKQVRVDVIHSSTQDVVISFLRGDFGNPT